MMTFHSLLIMPPLP